MGSRELKSSLSVKPLNEVYICVFPLCYMSFFQCQVNEVWVWQNTAHACFDISLTVAIPQSQTHTHTCAYTHQRSKALWQFRDWPFRDWQFRGCGNSKETHTHTHTHTHARSLKQCSSSQDADLQGAAAATGPDAHQMPHAQGS